MNDSVILRTTTRWLLPLLLVFSLFLLLRGHNEPGGGFVSGLTAAGAFALYRIAFGQEALDRLVRISPASIAAGGLALAVGAALMATMNGTPFFQALWLDLGNGPLPIGTPLVFDIGVALVVLGFAMLILRASESIRD